MKEGLLVYVLREGGNIFTGGRRREREHSRGEKPIRK